MNLTEFVEKVLVQIAQGVHGAQKGVAGTGATINPAPRGSIAIVAPGGVELQNVEFDVAVSASEETEGKGGITVLSLVGVAGEKKWREESVSRVKFTVPIGLPVGKRE